MANKRRRTEKEGEKMSTKIDVPAFGYLFIQSAMLVIRYALKYDMPFWVTWFPSLITGGVLIIVLTIVLVGLIISAFIK